MPKVRHLIVRAIAPLPHVLEDPCPDVLVVGFSDSDVTLRVRWWVAPPRHVELSQGLDTVLLHLRDALQAARARASAPPQAVSKQGG